MKSIEEQRETSKIGLETFFFNFEDNSFDRISDEAIEVFERKIQDAKIKHKKAKTEAFGYIGDGLEIYFIQQELKAICEMKIIYAYKNFEIKLKFLLNAAYENSETSKMFKWEWIVDFLKSKKIDIKNIKSYDEINAMRNVNNAIKHSDNLHDDNKTATIKEFQNKKIIQYVDLINFYVRVQKAPINFMESLSNIIYKDLYVFNEDKIDQIADKLALRMTEKDAKLLITKLKEKY